VLDSKIPLRVLREVMLDPKAPAAERRQAAETLFALAGLGSLNHLAAP
jgi:hypothetical protein